jgi:hypothetical protein
MPINLSRRALSLGFLCLLAPALGGAQQAATDEVVGKVSEVSGSAVAMQDAMPRALKKGGDIYIGDVLSTARDSRLQIKMIDDAEFSLSERAVFVVQEYFLKQDGKDGNAVIRLMTGAVKAVSGKIAQLDNHPFQLRTEVATIGVRGTTFWGGILDGTHQFALLDGSAIIVENKAGRVEITRAGDGTSVTSDSSAPIMPTTWAVDKMSRAAAMTP